MKQIDIDRKLDLIQLSFKIINQDFWKRYLRSLDFKERFGIKIEPDDAIFELNYRLREGGVGYQFENGVIIRVDSQFVHTEIIKNALSLLSSEQFSGAEDEFLSAHKHYREGDHKDAIVDAGRLLRKHNEVHMRRAWMDLRERCESFRSYQSDHGASAFSRLSGQILRSIAGHS